ncbi:VOC family protein [Flavobacterium foetidum]|uniref:VOC family protein n=1 Tax=Flavobacterium foetidum TaxID=2026681 RepID=UPI0010758C5C|nr:VOC family protein [Flavobacterium foetidum]KAF2517034.1 glyoxalase [Flavobacterium foetidum]
MNHNIKSIRPFIGSKDFETSRAFYKDLGFEETILESNFSVFKCGETAFYLQDYYDKNWIENTMIFLEVDDVERYYNELLALNLNEKYGVKLTPIRKMEWGRECFLHDPAGVLWHFGKFN